MSALREILASFSFALDDSGLKKADAALSSTIGTIKEFAGALGAGLGLGAIFHFVNGLTEEADALQKQSDALGLSLAEMQEWNYAAMMQRVSGEALAKTLGKLSGGKYDKKALAELGVAAEESGGKMKSGTDLLEDVAEALSKIDDPAKRNGLAMKVLGKSYLQLMPLLQDGAKGIEELKKEFDDLGGGFSPEFAKESDAFGDNIDRMKTVWKNLMILVVGRVLPTLVTLSSRLFQLAAPVMNLIKHGKLLETAFAAVALKGVLFLSGKIGPLGSALKMLSKEFFKVVLPLLVLEDLLVFLAGGDSVIGRLLEKLGGKGTADKVRAWVGDVKKEFLGFIDDLKSRPEKLADDWQVFTTALSADIKSLFGDTFGEMLNIGGGFFVTFIDALTGGWDNFATKTGATWDEFVLMFKIVQHEIAGGFVEMYAGIADGWISILNGLVSGAQMALRMVGKVAHAVGADSASKAIGDVAKGLEYEKGDANLAERVAKARYIDRTSLAGQYDNIQARFNGTSEVHAPVQVNVTVPAGTPADMAKRVGDAAANGTTKGINLSGLSAHTKPGGA